MGRKPIDIAGFYTVRLLELIDFIRFYLRFCPVSKGTGQARKYMKIFTFEEKSILKIKNRRYCLFQETKALKIKVVFKDGLIG